MKTERKKKNNQLKLNKNAQSQRPESFFWSHVGPESTSTQLVILCGPRPSPVLQRGYVVKEDEAKAESPI